MDIAGIGSITATGSTEMFSNSGSGIGIGDNAMGLGRFFLSPSTSYNLATNFGPLFNASPGAAPHSVISKTARL